MISFTREVLYHFNCALCKRWWSVGDHQLIKPACTDTVMACPHCGVTQRVIQNVEDRQAK